LASGRGARFDLGEGSEVLAAVWGAVARICDIVTIQSRGEVRFAPSGPEGALPLASWLGGREGNAAKGSRSLRSSDARATSAVSLAGKNIVHEAHDGARALEIAFCYTPDLVISDVLMPGIDGFALCRALKRDVVLRDV